MKPFFTEDDFDRFKRDWNTGWRGQVADFCNGIIEERGTVVYGFPADADDADYAFSTFTAKNDTHRALLINIEPIETEDTPEKVLEDLVGWEATKGIPHRWQETITIPLDIFERAKKLIGKKER